MLMADLTTKKVSEIRIRDSVMTELLKPRSVKEIRTQKIERPFRLVFLNGVGLTTGHPVLINKKWERSSDVVDPVEINSNGLASFVLYNFVLDGGAQAPDHSVILNGLVVCTLGKDCGPGFRRKFPDADNLYGTGYWKHAEKKISLEEKRNTP